MSIHKTMTVDRFLGLHQSADGSTERKPGEADVMENFHITDDYNLRLRPGTTVCSLLEGKFHSIHRVHFGGVNQLLIVHENAEKAEASGLLEVSLLNMEANSRWHLDHNEAKLRSDKPVKVFFQGNNLYIVGGYPGGNDATIRSFRIHFSENGTASYNHLYTPVWLTGCSPSGGGTELEPLNILNTYFKIEISANGTSKDYKLPELVKGIAEVWVDGEKKVTENGDPYGKYDLNTHTFEYVGIAEGVNNLVLVCYYDTGKFSEARTRFLNMRHCECFNGATDSRVFFYGDGSDICYYSGIPAFGAGLYIPAVNEISVDSASGPITAMRRHGSKLMAFKTSSAFTIDYSPVTLEDGRVIAGFQLHAAHKTVGNDMDDQVQTVNNCPRTFHNGVVYDWKHNASYYQDERYAKPVSQKVAIALRNADASKIVTCDNDTEQTYYMFLNDERGTVLLHRYGLDVWCMYTGEVFKDVTCAAGVNGKTYFSTGSALLYLDSGSAYDRWYRTGQYSRSEKPVSARWESGYYDMGMDYRRKYSSYLWISMLPEENSRMDVTVKTDRRDNYITKTIGVPLLSWEAMDFSNFSFVRSRAPRMKRIKLKAKKYVYYKLIFTVNHPGARATVLGYDQQVRFASEVK